MIKVNPETKQGQEILRMFKNVNFDHGSIFTAYKDPSSAKVCAYKAIERRAKETDGYNGDLHVVGRNSMMFSTMYSFTDPEEKIHIIYDKPSYTRELVV